MTKKMFGDGSDKGIREYWKLRDPTALACGETGNGHGIRGMINSSNVSVEIIHLEINKQLILNY